MTMLDRLIVALNPALNIDIVDERDFERQQVAYRDAAVLIPITRRAEPGVILTQRPQWLRSHAGQVAFPGGKVDDGDTDAIATALREAEEELGIRPDQVQIHGIADIYLSGSGFSITPVIGSIDADLPFDPNPDEVED